MSNLYEKKDENLSLKRNEFRKYRTRNKVFVCVEGANAVNALIAREKRRECVVFQ